MQMTWELEQDKKEYHQGLASQKPSSINSYILYVWNRNQAFNEET